jgi:sugar/nucleoside kinase (ribokinase family)
VSQSFDLMVVGRPSLDVIFADMPEWPALGKDIESGELGVCAGTSFNTPAAANRIGMHVAYVATLGNDPWSRLIRDEFGAVGLPTDFLEMQDRPLPAISVALNSAGDRGFVSHWGSSDDEDADLVTRALAIMERIDARHLHMYVDEAPELEAAASRRGMTVSVDAWGGPWWSSSRSLAETLAHADVLLANETEAAAMTGEADLRNALERAAEHCGCVVIKRGADGAIGLAGGQMRAVPADPVTICDTTGAGDSFNAGFLAGWLGGLPLEESLTLGVICGSRATEDIGGYRGCPTEAELRAIAAARGITLPRREASSQGEPI